MPSASLRHIRPRHFLLGAAVQALQDSAQRDTGRTRLQLLTMAAYAVVFGAAPGRD